MRVLVFGDSITQGFWDSEGGWVARLRKHYDEKQINDLEGSDEPVVFNLGVSADTTQNIISRLKNETISRTRHSQKPIIIVQIGVNDSMLESDKEYIALEEYKNNLREICKTSAEIASKLIFVGLTACDESKTVPVFWGDYKYINDRIKKYELALKTIAEENDISFISLFDGFKSALESSNNYVPDGLHPNDEGHKLIFEMVQPELDKLLASQTQKR